MKCIDSEYENEVKFFPPGSYGTYDIKTKNLEINPYYHFDRWKLINNYDEWMVIDSTENITQNIKNKLENSVKKRLISDRPIGCLLSGGLDSSIIAYLLKKNNSDLRTFSIGFKNSPDILSSQQVAEFLGTNHTSIIITEKDMLDAIEKTIYQIESYDITTIRASVPMYLLSKYILENTDIKVIFSGEGSDEASGSYLYFHNAPTPNDFQNECIRLLKEVHMFDALRGDKTTSGNGLEIRVPFFDKEFMDYYMSIDPKKKMIQDGIEKYLLRKSFEFDLPKDIVWRRKDGFSDGISKLEKPWYEIIEEYSQSKYKLSESEMYKMIYKKYYFSDNLPHYWMPKWSGELTNPSGRLIID
jgi:asparagine synthase (glutamine-hydrolysing)